MLSINFGTKTEAFAEEHHDELKNWVLRRKNKYANNSFLETFVNSNLEIILKGNPIELKNKDSEIKTNRFYSRFKTEIEKIFDYTAFRKSKK